MTIRIPRPQRLPKGLFWRLLRYVRPYRSLFIQGLLLTLSLSVLNPLRPWIVQYTLDHAVAEGNARLLQLLSLTLLGLMLLQVGVQYLQLWTTSRVGQCVMHDMRQHLFQHLISLRLQYFDRHPIGALQTRAISDIQTLSSLFSEGLVTILGELLQLVTILGLMFWTDWRLTLVVLTVLPLLVLATWIFKRSVTEAFQRVRRYVSELNAFIQEHITGLFVVQLYNQQEREARKFDELNRRHLEAHLDTVRYYSIFFPVVEVITAIALALLVWYGTGQVVAERMTFGTLVAFLLYIQMFFRPIRQMADQFNSLQLAIVSGERIFKVLDTQEHIPDPPQGLTAIPRLESGIEIEFEEVEFGYLPDEPVLRGISFRVPPCTTTAIVGATGSGKSSILNVLNRFYEHQAGRILLNGEAIETYRLATLREHIGLVQQDVVLFSGTIHDNITLGDESISRAAVEEAARRIGVDAFVQRLPGGYDYSVGERGATLSTGQRQLLAFVRVMVRNPPLLLLDEATANVDSESEALIQQAIQAVLGQRTALIIAHRLSTIQKADQILVMHRGQIVERGTHQSLLKAEGYYKRLYLLQQGRVQA